MEDVSEVGTLSEESGEWMPVHLQCPHVIYQSIHKASTKPSENWSQATLDKVLIKGNLLYTNIACIVGPQYILPDEHPRKIPIEGGFCQITFYESVSGTLFQSDKEINPFHNLEQAITCLEIWNYAFMTFGNKTPSYTIGLL
ncbi:hypothetical protein ACJMK2_022446 [Sinanodonta woodiana]|uniref:Uncharacterized protein n=1 Tax=Sinanodonta woodiana TaxID=1069815 RepID=A0ABD3TJ52_SINWO